jgi:digeranylgeranylglycerophospholipid reductase
MCLNNYYDIVVVGAGPAGSTAARFAAEAGVSVLLLEKDRDVGYPVRCGEAVSRSGLEPFIEPDNKWIAAEIDTFALVAPNDHQVDVHYQDAVYVLERRIFDYELAQIAATKGADILTRAYVNGLIIENGTVCGVTYEYRGEQKEVRCKVVIAADGVESRVGRWAGLKTHSHFRDMESSVQFTVANVDIDQKTMYFYFGKDVAPHGYLWVFPKGGTKANIGLGISGEIGKRKSAISYLNDFMQRRFPKAAILTQVAGGVPCEVTLKQISGNGILLAGDAAKQVNPLSGGGITSGMIGGSLAGKIAAESITLDKPEHVFTYDKAWHERNGKRHETYNRLKEGIYDFTDETFNNLAKTVDTVPIEKRTMGRIFTQALIHQPSLLIDVAKVFII